jgi:RNA polymerase sigma-70 factor, ECF subfamily
MGGTERYQKGVEINSHTECNETPAPNDSLSVKPQVHASTPTVPPPTLSSQLEAVMRRNNQRLFRVARSVLRNDADAEEVLQDVYLAAFSSWPAQEPKDVAAWLTSVTFRRCVDRVRANVRRSRLGHEVPNGGVAPLQLTPEVLTARQDVRRRLERALEALPVGLRAVFVLRDVQGLSGTEAATALHIPEPAVRVRLNRARARLRAELGAAQLDDLGQTFEFGSARCDRLVAAVLRGLNQPG